MVDEAGDTAETHSARAEPGLTSGGDGTGERDHAPAGDARAPHATPPARPSRRRLTAIAIPLVSLTIAGYIGDATWPTLVDEHPAWLLALNARNRHLVLITNSLDAWTYYLIGTARLLASDPLFFLLGFWYGDAAVRWLERRTNTWGQMLRTVERWFAKAAYPLIFVAPNSYICLFAGAAGLPVAGFLIVNLAGTLTRLYLVRRFGEALESPIDDVVGWIGDNRLPVLAVTAGLVILSIALEAKRGETEVTALTRLEDELEGERRGAGGSGAAGDGGERPAGDAATVEAATGKAAGGGPGDGERSGARSRPGAVPEDSAGPSSPRADHG